MARRCLDETLTLILECNANQIPSNRFIDSEGKPSLKRAIGSLYDEYNIGDEISIPKDYHVYNVELFVGQRQCIIVDIVSLDGSKRKDWFCPNSLIKCIAPIDECGRRSAKVRTMGTVAEWYAKQETIDDAMKMLEGKTIVVDNKTCYSVIDYAHKYQRTEAIYKFEWKNGTSPRRVNISRQITSMVNCLLYDKDQLIRYMKTNEYYDINKSIVRFWFFDNFLNETVLFKKEYSLSKISKELPMDFMENMDAWVSHISKQKNGEKLIYFDYAIDCFYPKSGKYYTSTGEVNGKLFVDWE